MNDEREDNEKNIQNTLKSVVSGGTLEEKKGDFLDAKQGSITFMTNGTEETLCYVPIEGTDWMMAVLIHESVIQDRIRNISENSLETSKRQIAFTLFFSVVFFLVLLYMLKTMSKKDLEAE